MTFLNDFIEGAIKRFLPFACLNFMRHLDEALMPRIVAQFRLRFWLSSRLSIAAFGGFRHRVLFQ
jgi:hypothetical protein